MRGSADVVLEQLRNIFRARAQRRQLDANDVEAVIEVFAEHAARDAILQVLVSGGDHAHIHANRRLTADAIELAFREHAEQSGLQRRRHVADFVEEQRAAVRLLEAAAPLRIRAGERALLVAEQLGLEKIRRNRRRIQRNERLRRTRAVIVKRARDELLTRARLTRDQHRDAGASESPDRAEHLLHGRRATEQLRNLRNRDRLRSTAWLHASRATHEIHRLIDIERLRQILRMRRLRRPTPRCRDPNARSSR